MYSVISVLRTLLYMKTIKDKEIADFLEKICISILQTIYKKREVIHELLDKEDSFILSNLLGPKLIKDEKVVNPLIKKIIDDNYEDQSNFIKRIISIVKEMDLKISEKVLFLEFLGNRVFYTIKLSFGSE